MTKTILALAALSASASTFAALPPCLTPSTYGTPNPGFNANDPRIQADGVGGYYEKVPETKVTVCAGTAGQCGDSAKATALLQSASPRTMISTAAAGYAPVGSQKDFARRDACLNLAENTSLNATKNGSATDALNPVGQKVPVLDNSGRYVANSGGEITVTVPPMPAPLTGLNNLPWASNGRQVKYHTIVPNGFTGVGAVASHSIGWSFIASIDGASIDAAFPGMLGTSYAYMSAVATYGTDAAMATAIESGVGKFGAFFGSDPSTRAKASRTVLSFQCPDDMTLVGQDDSDLAGMGYTRRVYFQAPAELTAQANQLEAYMVAASDAGFPPPQTSDIATLRTYLQSLPGSSDIRVVDLVITRRFGLGHWGILLAITQAATPAAVASGVPKAFDYFLNPASSHPVAMPYLWAWQFLTQMTYTPLQNNATTKLDGHYWDIKPSPLCRPKHVDFDFFNPYAGRSLN